MQELSYDLKRRKTPRFITPKQGFLTREDIRTAQSDFKYDIIFVLDTPDLETLGKPYDSNTELFYKKPIINIDHNSANGRFGQINLIDTTASSSSEVIFDLMQKWQTEAIDADIATALLAGMITKTNSFKTENTKPNTLTIASRLMHLGANRDHIVQNLYRTRAISTLKLWGQALLTCNMTNQSAWFGQLSPAMTSPEQERRSTNYMKLLTNLSPARPKPK